MVTFAATHLFPFPFRDVALGVWSKYPNEYSTHITSVDVLDRSFLPDGTLRTERLIAIRQNAPRWIMKLVGGAEEQYVREVVFYKVPNGQTQQPMILMGSVNLSMSSILICRERIRYQASDSKATSFVQFADMQAQGSLSPGRPCAFLGSKLESWSRDRFSTNAEAGRRGFYSVLKTLHSVDQGSDERQQKQLSSEASTNSDPSHTRNTAPQISSDPSPSTSIKLV